MTPVTKEMPRAQSELPNSRAHIDLTNIRASSVAPRNKKKAPKVTTRAPLVKIEPSDSVMMPPPSTPTGSRALVLYKGPPKQRSTTPSPSRRRSTTPRMPFPWRKRATPTPTTARGHQARGSSATVNDNGQASQTRSPTPGPSRHSRQPSATSTRFTSPGAAFGGRGRAGDSPDTAIDVDEEDEEEEDSSMPPPSTPQQRRRGAAEQDDRDSTLAESMGVTLVLKGSLALGFKCNGGAGQIRDSHTIPIDEGLELPNRLDLNVLRDEVAGLAQGILARELKIKSRNILQRAVKDAM